MKKILFFTTILLVLLLTSSLVSQAQIFPDPCTAPEDPCPIDSNLIVLMVAAVGIAAKKAYDYKKKQIQA